MVSALLALNFLLTVSRVPISLVLNVLIQLILLMEQHVPFVQQSTHLLVFIVHRLIAPNALIHFIISQMVSAVYVTYITQIVSNVIIKNV